MADVLNWTDGQKVTYIKELDEALRAAR